LQDRIGRTAEISKTTMEVEERGVKLRLTVVDVPGFGDDLEGSASWKACSKYIDDQFAAFYEGESGLNRKGIVDTRVHCCLYFVPPYGHALRQIDVEFMKKLHYKVSQGLISGMKSS
jgi:septin family protein